jgi:hypothetical protein
MIITEYSETKLQRIDSVSCPVGAKQLDNFSMPTAGRGPQCRAIFATLDRHIGKDSSKLNSALTLPIDIRTFVKE